MADIRIQFDKAVIKFREFLRSQEWSDSLLWLTRERIIGRGCRYWVFRPEELTSDKVTRGFYETVRKGSSSIRIDGLAQVDGKALCYVEDYGGEGRLLNYGIRQGKMKVTVVRSRLLWVLRGIINRFRGESAFLTDSRITEFAEGNP